jgi:hypothetical protein
MRTKLTVQAVGLAAMFVAVPAHAALDEAGGGAPRTVVLPAAEGFDWADAGIGGGIGVAVVLTLGAAAAIRYRQGQTRSFAGPLAR